MHPTPQGVTLDFEQYDKLKDVDSVAGTKSTPRHERESNSLVRSGDVH
jgi:hypothetical protein